MKRRQISTQIGIFLLVFVIAILVRFYNLGKTPLSDFEASWALRSWEAVFRNKAQIGSNPAYFTLTNLLFYLFGSNNFLTRFWPALMGSMIIWVPFGLQDFLGFKAAVIMSVGLALDPGMVAVSRIAGGPMMALGFFLFFITFFILRKPVWAGIFGGLGVISGPSFFLGLLGFLISWGINRRIKIYPGGEIRHNDSDPLKLNWDMKKMVRHGLSSAFITIILVSVIFSGFPGGLGGLGNSLITFFRGWVIPSAVPILQPSIALVFYQTLASVFALIAIIRSWFRGDKLGRWLSIWFFVALVLTIVYSQRLVFNAIWVIIPLWALASMELVRYVKIPEFPKPVLGQTVLLFTLGVIFWLVSTGPGFGNLTSVILIVVPVLAILSTFLIGFGWSWDSARLGAAWGLVLTLGIYTISSTFGAAQIRQNSPEEFWYPGPATGQAELLLKTLEDLGLRETGRDDWIQTASLVNSDSLRWLLRDVQGVTFISDLDLGELPVVIISPGEESELSRTISYRGQDFIWNEWAGWSGPLPQPLWPWVTSRIAPINSETIILWARSDLFPEDQELMENEKDTEPLTDEVIPDDGSVD